MKSRLLNDLENKAWALDNEPIMQAYEKYILKVKSTSCTSLDKTKLKVLRKEILKRLTDRTHLY